MDFKKEIGRRIQRAREDLDLTLAELSLKTGEVLSPNRISNYETGFRMPGPSEVVVLAKALGKRPAYLMALEDAQLPISELEERFILNWRVLPERERMNYFRNVEQMSMAYRDTVGGERAIRVPETPKVTAMKRTKRRG